MNDITVSEIEEVTAFDVQPPLPQVEEIDEMVLSTPRYTVYYDNVMYGQDAPVGTWHSLEDAEAHVGELVAEGNDRDDYYIIDEHTDECVA